MFVIKMLRIFQESFLFARENNVYLISTLFSWSETSRPTRRCCSRLRATSGNAWKVAKNNITDRKLVLIPESRGKNRQKCIFMLCRRHPNRNILRWGLRAFLRSLGRHVAMVSIVTKWIIVFAVACYVYATNMSLTSSKLQKLLPPKKNYIRIVIPSIATQFSYLRTKVNKISRRISL